MENRAALRRDSKDNNHKTVHCVLKKAVCSKLSRQTAFSSALAHYRQTKIGTAAPSRGAWKLKVYVLDLDKPF